MIKVIGEKLRQWDIDRTCEIAIRTGETLETVRFWKARVADPLQVAPREEDGSIIADIPNILLCGFGVLTVEVTKVDEFGHFHMEKACFTVHKAEKPDGYTYTETPVLELGSGGGGSGGGGIVLHCKYDSVSKNFTEPPVYDYKEIEAAVKSGAYVTIVGEDVNPSNRPGTFLFFRPEYAIVGMLTFKAGGNVIALSTNAATLVSLDY